MSKKNTSAKKSSKKSLAADIVKAATARAKENEKAAKAKAKEAEAMAKEKAKADAAKLNEAHGLAIAKATQKGIAIARKAFGADGLTENLSTAMGKGVNKNISITSTGLSVAKGYSPTEAEVTEAIAGLCGINEETSKFKTTVTWAIGDAVILADAFEGGGDRVAAQAISERGISKHTVLQAAVVCREFAPEDRIANLSFTHHQELRNYRKGIKSKKGYEKLIEELRETAATDSAMSCAELRERLRSLSGKVTEDEEDDEKADKKESKSKKDEEIFFYVSDTGDVKWSNGLNRNACKSGEFLIISATDRTVLNEQGAIQFAVKELDYGGEVEAEVVKTEPVKVEKPKKEKAPVEEKKAANKPKADKKAKSTAIPD